MPKLTEYKPGTAFPGVIARTVDESTPAWPEPLRARPGAPNVLFIVQDDTGFGQLGCYGSPNRENTLVMFISDNGASAVSSQAAVPEGRHKLRFEFEPTGKPDIPHGRGAPGRAQLYIDGKLVGQEDIPLTIPLCLGLGGGIVCGADTGGAVIPDYKPPFRFTGTIYNVTVDVSGDLIKDAEAEMRLVMARQ